MYGVNANALSWFGSYLSDRSFHTFVRSAFSLGKNIHFSIPQGFILGPVLYSVYASPLGDLISQFDANAIGYVDDDGIYRSYRPTPKSEMDVMSKLEQCLEHNWMNSNKLRLNPAKT